MGNQTSHTCYKFYCSQSDSSIQSNFHRYYPVKIDFQFAWVKLDWVYRRAEFHAYHYYNNLRAWNGLYKFKVIFRKGEIHRLEFTSENARNTKEEEYSFTLVNKREDGYDINLYRVFYDYIISNKDEESKNEVKSKLKGKNKSRITTLTHSTSSKNGITFGSKKYIL